MLSVEGRELLGRTLAGGRGGDLSTDAHLRTNHTGFIHTEILPLELWNCECCQDDGKDLVCEFLVAGQVPTGSAVDKVANHRYKI